MIKQSKKRLLINFVDGYCEICKKQFEEKDLQIHRIRRGCDYNCYRSLMVLCKKCHSAKSAKEKKDGAYK
jgi:hypothetical protein